jgi:copper chaperone NosL
MGEVMRRRDADFSRRTLVAVFVVGLLAACGGTVQPVGIDPSSPCGFCRMAISEQRFAAQIVAPGEEPRVFDDIGCLAGYLARTGMPARGIAYVADHRTGRWIDASKATYTFVANVATPMGSHLIAHADAASRDADDGARGGEARGMAAVFGASLGGTREP